MAKITKGILGGVAGKVGNVVGGRWKTTDYIRSYVIPANPRTAGQISQRAKMTNIVAFAKLILGSIINAYWDPFLKAVSGYNQFIKKNIDSAAAPITYSGMKMSEGKLLATAIATATYNTGTGEYILTWDSSAISNQKSTDPLVVLIYSEEVASFFQSIEVLTRTDATIADTITTGLDPAKLHAYMFFSQYDGSELKLVSTSDYSVVSAP